ncbi:MAG TPA: glycosyltransferase family 39 protein [Luteitalea sp.]|nr:glycosyltransferase family 39 protein [Luteitalea sp.]
MSDREAAATAPSASRHWIGGWTAMLAAWLVVTAALVTWLAATPAATLREHLVRAQFWSLEVCAWLAAACVVALGREVWRRFDGQDRWMLSLTTGLALLLTLVVAPRTHRIFYDEQIYQGVGQNLSDLKRAQMCNDGTVDYGRLECLRGEYNKQPYAFPHLLSVAYRIVGVGIRVPFAINVMAMVVTVWAVYAWALIGFGDRLAAGFAAVVIATVPHQVLWSATGAVEPTASLACLLAVLAAVVAVVDRRPCVLLVVGVLFSYAAQFRPESLLIGAPIAVVLWGRHTEEDDRRWIGWALLLVLALLAVHVGHLFAVRNEGWGTTGPRLSLSYVWPNLTVNGPFYVADERFPALYTWLALFGILAGGAWRPRLASLVYFGVFFGIGLAFYAGSYNYGADVRYSLLTYPPLAVLAGVGAARLTRWVARRAPQQWATALVTLGLLVQATWYAPVMRATTQEAWAARADVRYAQAFAKQLPPHAYVLTQNPAMFHVLGVSAGQMSLVTTNPLYLPYLRMRHPSAVYVHWNYWCNVPDQVQQDFCRQALAAAPVRVVGEYRERDQRFAFYRVEPIEVPATAVGGPSHVLGERGDVAKSH